MKKLLGQMYIYIDPIDNTWVGPIDGTFMVVPRY